jgi:hypothetical protein
VAPIEGIDPSQAYNAVAGCEVAIVVHPLGGTTAADPSGEAGLSRVLIDAGGRLAGGESFV